VSGSPATDPPLPVVRAAELPVNDCGAHWLVEELWARAAVGVIGGAPKCCKSWLGLDLALSVASATACLGRFPVVHPGPVLLHLAEDSPALVRARLEGLCLSLQIDLRALPIHVITSWSLRLDLARDQRRLDDAVRALRPRLLLLDPFVRLHRVDENDAGEVSALLGWLRALQREHDLAVAVVHHARKSGSTAGGGQALRGSGDFHAWGDSNLYLRRARDRLVLSVEHRAAPAPDPLALVLRTCEAEGAPMGAHLDVVDDEDSPDAAGTPAPAELDAAVLTAIVRAGAPQSRSALRTALHVRNQRLGDALARLTASGQLRRDGDLWLPAE